MGTIFTIADGLPVLLLHSKDKLLLLIRASVQFHQAMMLFQKRLPWFGHSLPGTTVLWAQTEVRVLSGGAAAAPEAGRHGRRDVGLSHPRAQVFPQCSEERLQDLPKPPNSKSRDLFPFFILPWVAAAFDTTSTPFFLQLFPLWAAQPGSPPTLLLCKVPKS